MSDSTTNASCLAITIHKASKTARLEFQATMESFVAALVVLPIVRNKLLKCTIISASDEFDEYIKTFGMPASAPQPTVPNVNVNAIPTQTSDQMLEIFNDGAVQKEFFEIAQKISGEHFVPSGVDVIKKLDKTNPVANSTNILRVLGLFQVPSHLTRAEYSPKLEALVDKIIAHPTIQKNMLRYTIWRPNKMLDSALGVEVLPTKSPFVILLEAKSWDAMVEIAKDEGVQQIIASGHKDFSFHAESSSFCVNISTKFEK
ncbi:hypothetical protein MSAN_02067100 [Mycena sanguinolenta]|uniref:Uncharacterized protein n=1 Tax=Mycena sanguinolenta TaxID=230812 RepID=A0A8H6XIH8_9AGAR|nr:hypothetical protein MSAN_02067100 [Mycena sanguinolenta]